jgi:type IV pilus assembly protein PilO
MAITKQDLIKMPAWQKGLSLAGFILLLGAVWYFMLYGPQQEEITVLQTQIQRIQNQIREQQKAKEAKTSLTAQIKALQEELKVLSGKLPEEKELPALLSSINEVGRLNGLDFTLFRQGKPVRREFYSEIPVEIQVQGGFHQVLLFLTRLGAMDRIIHVSKVKMGNYKEAGGVGTLATSLEATTYKYESTPLPAKEAPKGKKPAPAPPTKSGKGAVD